MKATPLYLILVIFVTSCCGWSEIERDTEWVQGHSYEYYMNLYALPDTTIHVLEDFEDGRKAIIGQWERIDEVLYRNGKWRYYDKYQKDLVRIEHFVMDTLHGPWSEENGFYREEGYYHHGNKAGEWNRYENGTIVSQTTYNDSGIVTKIRQYQDQDLTISMDFPVIPKSEFTEEFLLAEKKEIDRIIYQDTNSFEYWEGTFESIESDGTLKIWELDDEVVKLEFSFYEEVSDVFTTYYYRKGQLCAVFSQIFSYDPGCGDPDGTRELQNDYQYYNDEPDYYVIGCRAYHPYDFKEVSNRLGKQVQEQMLGAKLWLDFTDSDLSFEEFFGHTNVGLYAYGW